MTALAEEVAPVVADKPASEPVSDLDEVLWQAWKAMDLPEATAPRSSRGPSRCRLPVAVVTLS